MVDVWLTPAGVYEYRDSALTEYGSLPRFDNWLHFARIQTSATKIQGVYMRRPTRPLRKAPAPVPFSDYQFLRNHVVPTSWVAFKVGGAATKGAVLRTSTGDLWVCEQAGTAAGEPAVPEYTEEGNAGFGLVASGTAAFTFRGRSAMAGAWRVSARAGVTWYFSHIAAGLLADRFPAQAKAYLQAAAKHLVNTWVSGEAYAEGRVVAGATTQGRVWECVVAGTAGGSPTFTSGAAVGATVTDGALTWRCIGTYAHTAQRWFWYDSDPTMRKAKSPDNHDSYAATYLWAVWRYLLATNGGMADYRQPARRVHLRATAARGHLLQPQHPA